MKGFSPELRKDAIFEGFSSRNAYLELHNRASKMQSSQGLVRGTRLSHCALKKFAAAVSSLLVE